MKEVTAKLSYLRQAPRKIRLLADMVRGKKVSEAKALLSFNVKRGALPLEKLLDSAIANAKNNFEIENPLDLYVSMIKVDEGPKLKRWRARSRGRAFRIEKKTSHISLMLSENKPKDKKFKYPRQEIGKTPVIKESKKVIKATKVKKDGGFAPTKAGGAEVIKPKKRILKPKRLIKK